MTYRYKGYDQQSQKSIKGLIDAPTSKEAKERLKKEGILVETLRQQFFIWKPSLPSAFLIDFGIHLSLYLKAGFTLAQGLHFLADNYPKNGREYAFLHSLIDGIERGHTLSDALELQSLYKIPPHFIHMVQISQKSGQLAHLLLEITQTEKERNIIEKEMIKALIYPSFILTIAFAMIGFMLTHIIPTIVSLFEKTKSSLPTVTKITIAISTFFQDHLILLSTIPILMIIILVIVQQKSRTFAYWLDWIALKTPLIGDILLLSSLEKFSSILSLLLKHGAPFTQALHDASQAVSNRVLQQSFQTIQKNVIEGHTLTIAIKKEIGHTLFPNDFINTITLGEKSSHLPETLRQLSELYHQKNHDKIELFLSLLEPIVMLMVGGIIGFLVISVLLPIFSLSLNG